MLAQAALLYHVKACENGLRMGGKNSQMMGVDASFAPWEVQKVVESIYELD